MPAFIELLHRCRIFKPDHDVIAKIRASYAAEALMSIDNGDAALELYRRVKALPSSFTKNLVAVNGRLRINGPLSLDRPRILTGCRLDGRPILVKLLSLGLDDTTGVKTAELNSEADCCSTLATSDHTYALVPYEVVTLQVTPDMVSQTQHSGAVKALVMPRYLDSIARGPSCIVSVVSREGRRMVDALRCMHQHGYVHMDVKGDNVFFDAHGAWYLGDFGSACVVDSPIRSTTESFYHCSVVGRPARPQYDWFMLLVMLIIELGDNKDKWTVTFVDEGGRHVSEARVLDEAQRIIADSRVGSDLKEVLEEIIRAYSADEV